MDEKSVEDLRKKLYNDEAEEQSQGIKQEDMRRFDEINGDHYSADDADQEEERDEVGDLAEGTEKKSQVSRISGRSKFSSRTYVTRLEKQLNEEKEAREKLERELEEIKRLNQEITSHLKSTHGSFKA